MGVLQHVRGHGGLAAELARQRPFRPDAVGEDAAEHLRAGRRAGDLLDLGLAVDGVEPHAEGVGPGDVALLLDGVAVADAVSRGAGRQHHLDLGDRGGVEAGAELGQQRQHLRGGVRLDGVEHPGVRQGLGEVLVVGPHDVEIDDEDRSFVLAALAALLQEFTDARSHMRALPSCRRRTAELCGFSSPVVRRAMGTRRHQGLSEPLKLPWLGLGRPRTALLAMNEQASTVTRADWWKSRRDLRSPLRRCFKPRPLRRAECAGFASSCRSDVLKSSHSPGGWPASCPATYRSTHGHRHVRNWASIEIIYL